MQPAWPGTVHSMDHTGRPEVATCWLRASAAIRAARDTVVGAASASRDGERTEGRRAVGMETFATHTGRGVALRRAAAVPDVLARWQADPGLVLGRPEYAGATILIVSPDFAACPAREQAACRARERAVTEQASAGQPVAERAAAERAASALASHGFLMVASAGFDEIFCHSMTKSGVRLLCLSAGKISELQDIVDADPATLLTVDFVNREMAAADKFSAVFEIVDGARWQLLSGRADADEAARDGSKIAEPGGDREELPQAAGPARLAGRIRASQRRIACLDVAADVRIQLQRRLVAVCDAMKAATADPARCEQRLASLAAELDRLTAAHGTTARPDHIS
jgi:3-isopropylmalate dehydratase small subunit